MSNTLSTPLQSLSIVNFEALATKIPDDPKLRLSPKTVRIFKELKASTHIKDAVIDIHYHAFTHKHIPKQFLKNVTWISEGLVKKYLKLTRSDFFRTQKLESSKEITDQLFDIYQNTHPKKLKHIFASVLMMDMERAIDGEPDESFEKQIAEIKALRKEKHTTEGITFDYKDSIIPFFALDPHNPNLFKQFIDAFTPIPSSNGGNGTDTQTNFHGVKLYPALGYLPYHPALMKVFKVCEEKGIPITSHCGGVRTHPSKDIIKVEYLDQNYQPKSKTIHLENSRKSGNDFSSYFIRPEHWERVLKKYPDLKVNIAHLGDNSEWRNYRQGERSGTVQRTFQLVKDHKNVFADLSYSFYTKANVKAIYKKLKTDSELQSKIMYGSDYYMCQIERGEMDKYYKYIVKTFQKEMDIYDKVFVKNAIDFLS